MMEDIGTIDVPAVDNTDSAPIDDDVTGGKSSRIPIWGNHVTMNLPQTVYMNIIASSYFKSLFDKKTYHEVIDEIYYQVSSLDPFIQGTAPSSAFCLLFKLFTLKLTHKQMKGLLNHTDSPYIRALGFLYLRYCSPPTELWSWYEPYIQDPEELDLCIYGKRKESSTIGGLCVSLLSDQKFQNVLLPRIPVTVQRQLDEELSKRNLLKSKNKSQSGGSQQRNRRLRSLSPVERTQTSRPSDDYDERRDKKARRKDDHDDYYRGRRGRDDDHDDRYRSSGGRKRYSSRSPEGRSSRDRNRSYKRDDSRERGDRYGRNDHQKGSHRHNDDRESRPSSNVRQQPLSQAAIELQAKLRAKYG